jgi:hypothetical protein
MAQIIYGTEEDLQLAIHATTLQISCFRQAARVVS